MRTRLIVGLLAIGIWAKAERISRIEYIDQWKEIAVREMLDFKIPASITLAQGILESGDGNSELAVKANNHFGIKCHKGWTGKKMYYDDDRKGECFRVYENAEASYHDHSLFLTTRSRYSFLFDLEITDYKGWAKGLKKAGYATNPKYADLLIKLIEENALFRFDTIQKLPSKSDQVREVIASADPEIELKIPDNLQIFKHPNRIKYIVVYPGLTYSKIEEEVNVWDWEIRRYNDLSKNYQLQEGDTLFIQPKRNKAKVNHHIVEEGESLREISQEYGIKVKAILRRNRLDSQKDILPGMKLYLRGRKPRQ